MPPLRLRVGMFSQNSPAEPHPDDVQSRLNQLQQGMQAAFNLIPSIQGIPIPPPLPPMPGGPPPPAPPLPGSVLRVFLAPEYFFRKNEQQSRAGRISTAYSETEKDAIVMGMRNLSRTYQNFLFIGGSVLWIDSATGSVFVRHSMYVFLSGTLIHTYEKKNDCNELQQFERAPSMPLLFQPGVVSGLFACQGLSCGLETCLDHDMAQLRQDGASDLDLQIVLSNTVTIRTSSVRVQPRGYILHCNAGPFGCRVYQNPFDQSGNIDGTTPGAGYASAQNGKVGLFDLPWPAAPAPVHGTAPLRMVTR